MSRTPLGTDSPSRLQRLAEDMTHAPRTRIVRHVAALGIAAGCALTTAGCAYPLDALHKVHSESFDDLTAAQAGWVGVVVPDWIPADAGIIRTTATLNESNAVVSVDGGSAPEGCVTGARRSLPFDSRYGGISSGDDLPATVLQCGSYEVVQTGAGWLGWFNATEEGQTPENVGP
jgi:hypothetical protein